MARVAGQLADKYGGGTHVPPAANLAHIQTAFCALKCWAFELVWRSFCQYALAHFIILTVCVALTALLDYGVHLVQHRLEPDDDRRVRRADFRKELMRLVWMRLQGELMVVGSLVVWIWLSQEIGLLDQVAAFSVAWQVEHPSVPDNPISDPFSNFTAWLGWALSCHPRTPRDATTLLHVLQDVLVALFVAKVLYFLFLLLALRTQMEWLSTYERLESGGAPRNPAEHFSWRQIDAMREQLLQVLRSEPALQQQLQRSADLSASVENGSLYPPRTPNPLPCRLAYAAPRRAHAGVLRVASMPLTRRWPVICARADTSPVFCSRPSMLTWSSSRSSRRTLGCSYSLT